MNYHWILKSNENEKHVSELTQNLDIPLALAEVLVSRGISDASQARRYFNPSIDDLHDPFFMKDMQMASERILEGIKNGEQFWVHGDYDVDGTMSVALITLFLQELGANVEYFIPDRFQDTNESNCQSVELAIQKNTTILITVDMGITSFAMMESLATNNIDTIICDHHKPNDILPKAYAILNPFRTDCEYPFKPLAACGVVFKLIQAISFTLNTPSIAWKYFDFVAVSSAADMVPLIDENRVMLSLGLDIINNETRMGLKSLIYCAGLKQGNISASNIVYSIAPLINVAGRLGQAKRSVEMMISSSEIKSFQIAQELEDENRKRRVFDQDLFETVIPLADKQIKQGKCSLVIYGENWHPGVIGIVASRLVDKYQLPVVLLTKTEGYARGSARCSHTFDIYDALKQCDSLLVEFGGHKHAAGVTLDVNSLEEFSKMFDNVAKLQIGGRAFTSELEIDATLKFSDISANFYKIINKFAPFGLANPKPLFISNNVILANGIKPIGFNKVKCKLKQDSVVFDAICQNTKSYMNILQSGAPFSIVYNLEVYGTNGHQILQLVIKDISNKKKG